VDPFGSIAAPPQKLAASERVGGLCRYSIMLVAVIVMVVVSPEMQGNGWLKSTGGLGQYNFGGSFRVVY
jgi:hypothetical protein